MPQQFQAPSILGSIQQGLVNRQAIQQEGRLTREEANKQRLAQLESEQQAEQRGLVQTARGVAGIDPAEATQQQAADLFFANNREEGEKLFKRLGIETQEQKEELAAFADTALKALTPEGEIKVDEVNFLIDDRVRKIQARGGDASETLMLKDLLKNDPDKFIPAMQGASAAALTAFQRGQVSARGRGVGGAEKPSAPITLVNPDTKEKILVTPVFIPVTGKSRLEKADIPDGFEISRETDAEERAADLLATEEKEGAKVTGKAVATRRQKAVNQGFESSDQLPSLRRALTLLDTVKTGGVAAASIRAKQAFGVEGADEAELSNALSTAVLKQLKPTFGSAFTAEEGKSLTRISAGLGKSPAGNRRIIKQLIQKVEKKAKDGIKAAIASKDFESAQRIQDNLDFILEAEENDLSAQEQAELDELKQRFGQ